jgi:hypothetical protein
MCIMNVTIGYRHINRGATETARPSTAQLRRQRQTGVVHGVFPCRPGALAAILDEISFRASREITFPRGLKTGARLFEACRVAAAGETAM